MEKTVGFSIEDNNLNLKDKLELTNFKKYINDEGISRFIDLANALGYITGAKDNLQDSRAVKIAEKIGAVEHLIFILVDGLGMNLINKLPKESFFKSNVAMEMFSIFPSTTACALTTLATGAMPAQHAIPGWFAYLKEYNLSAITLPFIERFSEKTLEQYDVKFDDLYNQRPLFENIKYNAMVISHESFWNSKFSQYIRANQEGKGYHDISNAIDIAIKRIENAKDNTYTYIYLHELDSISHDYGVNSQETFKCLTLIENELRRLAQSIKGKGRIVVSADHGQIDINVKERFAIFDKDPILKYLCVPPTGDTRTIIFHVIKNKREEFVKAFNQRFGKSILLLSIDELDELRLLGQEKMTSLSRQRFGDFIGIAVEKVSLKYYPKGSNPENDHKGHHSGLSHEETEIPLIII